MQMDIRKVGFCKSRILIAGLCALTALASVSAVQARPGDRDRGDRHDRDRRGSMDVTGRVIDRKSDQRFTMRTDRGREITVFSKDNLARRLDRGDRVRVVGRWDDGRLNAWRVDIIRNR